MTIPDAAIEAAMPALRESIAQEAEAVDVIDSQGERRDGKRMRGAIVARIVRGLAQAEQQNSQPNRTKGEEHGRSDHVVGTHTTEDTP